MGGHLIAHICVNKPVGPIECVIPIVTMDLIITAATINHVIQKSTPQ